jgi:hypothetical protein
MAKFVRITQHVTEWVTVKVADDWDINNPDDYEDLIENADSLRTSDWKTDVTDVSLEFESKED